MKIVLLLCSFLLVACAGSSSDAMSKLDSPLARKVKEMRSAGDNQSFQVIAQFNQEVDNSIKTAIANSGVSLETTTGAICTVSGSATNIMRLAEHPAVVQMQLSQTRMPLNQ